MTDNLSPALPWTDAIETLLLPLTRYQRIGLITDVDGTISPIVPRPEDARITPRSRDLLAALVPHLVLVGVISGRAAADVRRRVGLDKLVYTGNHGLERWQNGQVEVVPTVLPYRPALTAAAGEILLQLQPGMQLEDKGATLSIHYRRTPDPDAIQQQYTPIMEQVAAQHGLKLVSGRMLYELRPPIAIDKGVAFRDLVSEFRLDAALFAGDDTTDADALRAARDLREQGTCFAVGIGVTADETPQSVLDAADVLVSGVTGMEDLLDWLLNAVSASST